MNFEVSICLVRKEDRARVLEDPAFAQALAQEADPLESVDLAEHWPTLHFAVTGAERRADAPAPGPLGRAVLGDGGAPVEALDCGHGPGRLLDLISVKEISAALAGLPTAVVAQRLLAAAGVNPGSVDEAELMIRGDYELFDDLKDLYADAADEGAGLLFTFG